MTLYRNKAAATKEAEKRSRKGGITYGVCDRGGVYVITRIETPSPKTNHDALLAFMSIIPLLRIRR